MIVVSILTTFVTAEKSRKTQDTKTVGKLRHLEVYYFFIIKDIIHLGVLLLFTSLQLVASNTSNQLSLL